LVLRRQDQAPQADQRTWDVVFSVREPYFKQVRQELKRARIPHEWNGLEVKVARKYESAVDQIMARCVTTR
jgi:hypothetical protein